MEADVRPVLAFFSSQRSGPARRMESPLAHLQRKERDRLRIARVDIDERPEVADRFQVTTVPTLVLLDSGREIARHEGRASLPTIERLLAPHLGPESGPSEATAAIA